MHCFTARNSKCNQTVPTMKFQEWEVKKEKETLAKKMMIWFVTTWQQNHIPIIQERSNTVLVFTNKAC